MFERGWPLSVGLRPRAQTRRALPNCQGRLHKLRPTRIHRSKQVDNASESRQRREEGQTAADDRAGSRVAAHGLLPSPVCLFFASLRRELNSHPQTIR